MKISVNPVKEKRSSENYKHGFMLFSSPAVGGETARPRHWASGHYAMLWITPLLCIFLCMTSFVGAHAQLPSFHAVSSDIEVGTVSVAFAPPSAQILTSANLSTPANIALLAKVQTICVLPYDAFNAKAIIQSLPSTDPIKEGLEGDKTLRQLRNETADELQKEGFSIADCLSDPSVDVDGELIFTKVLRDDGLPAYYWVLYAGEKSAIVVYGEKELLGLSRPSAMSLPLMVSWMVQQIEAAKNAAKRGS